MPKRRIRGTLALAAVLLFGLLPFVILTRSSPRSPQRADGAAVQATPCAECPSSTLEQGVDPAAEVCTGDCEGAAARAGMHLADVRGEVRTDPYGAYQLVVYVAVHSADHAPLDQVEVVASIWWPDGGPAQRTRLTHANGTARFHWGSADRGAWKLCVDSLTRDGYLHDPSAGEMPACAEWSN